MSRYEDYDRTSSNYDATRRPVAVERIVGLLAQGADGVAGKVILDAGCGTGQFTEVLVQRGAQVEAVELSTGMLAAARRKLTAAEESGQVRFQQGSITELPLDDGSVDGIVINQVLHHLPEPDDTAFPVLGQVLGEMRRVLRPGGALVVHTCSQDQLTNGYWYFNLMSSRVRAALRQTYAPLPELARLMVAAGFGDVQVEPVLDEVLAADHYHQADGPLSAVWRDGDSTWALLRPDELEETLAFARRLHAAGELEAYRDQHDAKRQQIGQMSLVTATPRL